MVISHSKPILLKGPERWEVTEGEIHEKWIYPRDPMDAE